MALRVYNEHKFSSISHGRVLWPNVSLGPIVVFEEMTDGRTFSLVRGSFDLPIKVKKSAYSKQ